MSDYNNYSKAEQISDALYRSRVLHDYKDGKIDFRFVRIWITENVPNILSDND